MSEYKTGLLSGLGFEGLGYIGESNLVKATEFLSRESLAGISFAPVSSVFAWIGRGNHPTSTFYQPEIAGIEELPKTKNSSEPVDAKFIDDFKAKINGLPSQYTSENDEAEGILTILKAYCWCLAAPGLAGQFNGNLYEFLKLRAAITKCLDLGIENSDKILFACIDLSGVQKFLYDIGSKGAAKSLKGRSFYLQLLLDAIIERLLHDLNLASCHVVYSSGGKCYLLLPNNDVLKTKFAALRTTIQQNLFNQFGLTLYVCMDHIELDLTEPENNYWRELSEKVSKQKSKKLSDFAKTDDGFAQLFTPQDGGTKETICQVSGMVGETVSIGDGVRISKAVEEQIDLGQKLARVEKIGVAFNKVNDEDIEPLGLGVFFGLGNEGKYGKEIYINDSNKALAQLLKGNRASFKFYGGNRQAMNNPYEPKTFEHLADDGAGTKKLGVFRADVDNLGSVFISSEKIKSLPAKASLSSSLDWFFSGYLNTIRNRDEYKGLVNILYSGGDDIFAVGHWDAVLRFGAEVRAEFQNYTNSNELSISAGLAMVDGKFPIAKAAEMAGQAEDEAKHYVRKDKRVKDALTVFGETVGWEEVEKIQTNADQMASWLLDSKIHSSLLQRVQTYLLADRVANKRNLKNNTNNKPDYSYIWNAAYALARFKEAIPDKINNINQVEYVDRLINIMVTTDRSSLPGLAISARWAELINKKQ